MYAHVSAADTVCLYVCVSVCVCVCVCVSVSVYLCVCFEHIQTVIKVIKAQRCNKEVKAYLHL